MEALISPIVLLPAWGTIPEIALQQPGEKIWTVLVVPSILGGLGTLVLYFAVRSLLPSLRDSNGPGLRAIMPTVIFLIALPLIIWGNGMLAIVAHRQPEGWLRWVLTTTYLGIAGICPLAIYKFGRLLKQDRRTRRPDCSLLQ